MLNNDDPFRRVFGLAKRNDLDWDEFDKESRNAAEDYVKQKIARDWSYEELQSNNMKLNTVTLKNLPKLWMILESALSDKNVLNTKGKALSFIHKLLGPASSVKKLTGKLGTIREWAKLS